MHPNIILFTGENSYALRQELRRWKSSFFEKHGESNFSHVDGKDIEWSTLLDESCAAPFLAEKRLIIIEGIHSKIEKSDLELLCKNIHSSTIIVFVEASLDKRKSTSKYLLKEVTVHSFTMLTPKQLVPWLIDLAQAHHMTLKPNIAAHLIARVGNDQWHLKSECLKLVSYTMKTGHQSEATERDIDHVCLPSQKHTVWIISDLIGKRKCEEAVQYSRTLHEGGEDAFALWNMLLWIVQNMAILWLWNEKQSLSIAALSKTSGVPFLSTQSLLPFIRTLSREQITRIVERFTTADRELKTGLIKASTTEPIEIITLLERQILTIQSE